MPRLRRLNQWRIRASFGWVTPNARVQLQSIQIRVRAKRAQSIAMLCQLQRSLGRRHAMLPSINHVATLGAGRCELLAPLSPDNERGIAERAPLPFTKIDRDDLEQK